MKTETILARNVCMTAARAAIHHAEMANRAAAEGAEAVATAHVAALQEDVDMLKKLDGAAECCIEAIQGVQICRSIEWAGRVIYSFWG